jgi:hypothetical protein
MNCHQSIRLIASGGIDRDRQSTGPRHRTPPQDRLCGRVGARPLIFLHEVLPDREFDALIIGRASARTSTGAPPPLRAAAGTTRSGRACHHRVCSSQFSGERERSDSGDGTSLSRSARVDAPIGASSEESRNNAGRRLLPVLSVTSNAPRHVHFGSRTFAPQLNTRLLSHVQAGRATSAPMVASGITRARGWPAAPHPECTPTRTTHQQIGEIRNNRPGSHHQGVVDGASQEECQECAADGQSPSLTAVNTASLEIGRNVWTTTNSHGHRRRECAPVAAPAYWRVPRLVSRPVKDVEGQRKPSRRAAWGTSRLSWRTRWPGREAALTAPLPPPGGSTRNRGFLLSMPRSTTPVWRAARVRTRQARARAVHAAARQVPA